MTWHFGLRNSELSNWHVKSNMAFLNLFFTRKSKKNNIQNPINSRSQTDFKGHSLHPFNGRMFTVAAELKMLALAPLVLMTSFQFNLGYWSIQRRGFCQRSCLDTTAMSVIKKTFCGLQNLTWRVDYVFSFWGKWILEIRNNNFFWHY